MDEGGERRSVGSVRAGEPDSPGLAMSWAGSSGGDPSPAAAPIRGETTAGGTPTGTGPLGEAAEQRRRTSETRRMGALVAVVPVLLGVIGALDSLPALFLLLALGQTAVFVALRRRRRRAGDAMRLGVLRVAPTPIGRAWFPLAWGLVLAAIFLASPPLRLMVCLIFTCSLATWPIARCNVDRVRVSREIDARARVGVPTTITYRIENSTRRSAHGLVVRDAFGLLASPPVLEACYESVGARQDASAQALLVFHLRGRRRLRPVRVTSSFPTGLFAVSCETEAPVEILVRPAEGRGTAALLHRLSGTSAVATRDAIARRGEADPEGLRDFRDGEDPRRIHWRTSARRGTLTYVERRDEGVRRILVILGRSSSGDVTVERGAPVRSAAGNGDARSGGAVGSGAGGVEGHRRFERAVCVAATVLRCAMRAGLPSRLCLGDASDARRPEIRGRRGLDGALDALAEVRREGERRPAISLAQAGRRADALVVWVAADAASLPPEALVPFDGGRLLLLRADEPGLLRYVKGLP